MKKVILLLIFSCSFSAFSNNGCKNPFSNSENATKKASEAKPLEAKASVTKASANKNETKKAPEAKIDLKEHYFSKYSSDNALLEVAIQEGDSNSVKYLLEEGNVDLDFSDEYENTFLHLATMFSKSPHSIALLLKAGADPNVQNIYGKTPLHTLFNNRELMSSNNIKLSKRIRLLNDRSPNTSKKPFGLKFSKEIEKSKELVRSEIIKLLLLNGADPNIQDEWGLSILHQAVISSENPDSIIELIKSGADVNIKEDNGISPLHLAISLENFKLVSIFLEEPSINTNIQSNGGLTPLHITFYVKQPTLGKFLLKTGADPNIQDENGSSVLHMAISRKDLSFISFLLLDNNAMKGKLNINLQDDEGQTPLHIAVKKNFWFGVDFLLEKQANILIEDNSGKTPIDLAKELNLGAILKLFEKTLADLEKESNRKKILELLTKRHEKNSTEILKEDEVL